MLAEIFFLVQAAAVALDGQSFHEGLKLGIETPVRETRREGLNEDLHLWGCVSIPACDGISGVE